MLRNYKRSTEKAQWSAADLSNAMENVHKGASQGQVAKKYGIPFSLFQQKFKTLEAYGPCMGRKSVFSNEQEIEIANNVKPWQICITD